MTSSAIDLKILKARICSCNMNGAEDDIGHFIHCPAAELEIILATLCEEIEEMKRQPHRTTIHPALALNGEDVGYNSALKDVLQKLSEQLNQK